MFSRDFEDQQGAEVADEGTIVVERDAPRPATILRVASDLEARGGRILELFKEVRSPRGQAVIPIHVEHGGQEFLVEVETRPWDRETVERALQALAVVRDAPELERVETGVELLSAYPVPPGVASLFGSSPAALLQADLVGRTDVVPETAAETFREAANRRWHVELDYSPESLPLAEELLLATLEGEGDEDAPVVLDALVEGLGFYLGEVIRRSAAAEGSWQAPEGWSDERAVLEFEAFTLDPIGNARAFLQEGPEESIAFFARFALEEVEAAEGTSSPVADS
jgi:hypothetical protein